ncbi:MAG: alcohol dehydrogenase catalytic domain-containing protein [Gemmatimonadales bacterium]|nr:alcohol dehydrogenase catalytic domain-containing protein [Gemmatimonadales bacterium]
MGLPTQNRVAVYHSNRDFRLETRPLPPIGAGELLLEVAASGICGSDVLEWYRQPKAPTVLGHEVAGRVMAVGDGVQEIQVGDRIVATHHVPCMVCRYCLTGRETMCEMLRRTSFDPGGFAHFIRVPAVNVERGVLKLPDHVTDDAGSMVEPLGCTLRGQRKVQLGTGDAVLILGSGVSGALHLLAARARGAQRVFMSDIEPLRCDVARGLGADRVLDAREPIPELVREELGQGVDHVIVCTGAPEAIAQALDAVDRGGSVLFFAPLGPGERFPLPFDTVFWRNDVTLTSSYGAGLGDMTEALDLVASGRVDVAPLVTHRLPLSEVQRGFELMLQARDSLKIIIDPRLDAAA